MGKLTSGSVNYSLWLLNSNSQFPINGKVFELNNTLELIETKIPVFPKVTNSQYGIRRSKNCIWCQLAENGDLLWKFELGENVSVDDLYIYENQIVVTVSTRDMIGINLSSGEETWRIENTSMYLLKQPNTNNLMSFNSNTFGDNFLESIDTANGDRIIKKSFSDFHFQTKTGMGYIHESKYYFITNLGYNTNTKESERISQIGCIDTQTFEMDWIEPVGKTDGRRHDFIKLFVNKGKMYVFDLNNHLFEFKLNQDMN